MISKRAILPMLSLLSLSSSVMSQATPDAPNTEKYWNVLSLDGGGIRGLITATVVDYMEKYAYNYTRDEYCIPERDTLRVSMAELFDMVAGTSTGSLLATSIVLPNNDTNSPRINKFFAEDAIKIYTE